MYNQGAVRAQSQSFQLRVKTRTAGDSDSDSRLHTPTCKSHLQHDSIQLLTLIYCRTSNIS